MGEGSIYMQTQNKALCPSPVCADRRGCGRASAWRLGRIAGASPAITRRECRPMAQLADSHELSLAHLGFFAAYLRAIVGKTGVCSSRGGSVHVARMDAWAAGANGFCGRLHTASVEYGARSRWFNSAAGLCTGSASETASDNP